MRVRAATLAVGTEVTDGQILDRNSAWLSQRLVDCGVEIVEHRAVADDRTAILTALREIGARTDLLFVTGGLGPTSDDFTRDVLAEFFKLPLEFDDSSWRRIEERFASRGMVAKPIQRQQCYFPRGARILVNQAGTANAFMFTTAGSAQQPLKVFALPGPPLEIATVWSDHLAHEMAGLVAPEERESLFLLRTLGRGESEMAEKVEEVLKQFGAPQLGVRVGYRAHLPYVEVKLWYPVARLGEVQPLLVEVESILSEWIVGRGSEDAVDVILDRMLARAPVWIDDSVSQGVLQARILGRQDERRPVFSAAATAAPARAHALTLVTRLDSATPANSDGTLANATGAYVVVFSGDEASRSWRLNLRDPQGTESIFSIAPTPLYAFATLRGRKYATERALQILDRHLAR